VAIGRLSPDTLRTWITDGHELALLDAREEGEFGSGHLFWAVPCPLSRAELRIPLLLPRIAVRTVCVDDGLGTADRLAALLLERGATDVQVLEGGTKAWHDAGYVLFTGVNVPSKAFGEWVEHHYGTESVDAPELKAWQDEGRDLVVLDSRPMDEFHRMSIPGGINVPGGELAYRVGDLVPDPNTLIVVNCGGPGCPIASWRCATARWAGPWPVSRSPVAAPSAIRRAGRKLRAWRSSARRSSPRPPASA
jgi:rhodanese-related sulfurtransferase